MRKFFSLAARAIVTGLLLYFAFRLVDIEAMRDRLRNIDLNWLALGALALLVQAFLGAIRWEQIVVRCGSRLTLARSFRFTMIAAFFNQTLPSSVGGDAVRIWLVGKHANWRAAAYSVLLDRIVGVVALACLVVICLPWTLTLVRDPAGHIALLMIGFGSIAAGLIFIALGWNRFHFMQRWSLTRHLAAVATIALQIQRTPSLLASIFGLSTMVHFLTVFASWCAARSVGANVSMIYLLFLILPVILISVVPISIAGWGVREGAMVTAFAYAGLPQSDGLIISLLFGILSLLLGLVGGVVWTLSNDRADGTSVSPLPHSE